MTELEQGVHQVPTTLSGALRLAAEQAELIEKQQAQLAVAEPKALVFDTSIADKSMSVSAFSHALRGANNNRIKAIMPPPTPTPLTCPGRGSCTPLSPLAVAYEGTPARCPPRAMNS